LQQQMWSMRYYEDVIENGERRRHRVQESLGTLAELPTKRLALKKMAEKLVAINNLVYRPRTTSTFREFAQRWMEECRMRKRKPIKPSTLHNWQCILDNHVLPALENMPLSDVGNTAMKRLVEVLVGKGLSPQTIKNITLTVKLVKASAVDEDGNEMYPTKWNHKFIDMPVVDETKQRKPSFTDEQVAKIVKATSGRMQMAAILFAASGTRGG
jgi:integrase-like protein